LIQTTVSIAILCIAFLVQAPLVAEPVEDGEEIITIIEQPDFGRIFEYRQNGILIMIKVVPDRGRPYYMVPADGTPHFSDLSEVKHLYPNWVLMEW
jgi:hypothetical protein